MSEKGFIFCLCVIGLTGVAYGMIKRNHPIFLAGLAVLIVGYLLIRKILKAYLRKRQE